MTLPANKEGRDNTLLNKKCMYIFNYSCTNLVELILTENMIEVSYI